MFAAGASYCASLNFRVFQILPTKQTINEPLAAVVDSLLVAVTWGIQETGDRHPGIRSSSYANPWGRAMSPWWSRQGSHRSLWHTWCGISKAACNEASSVHATKKSNISQDWAWWLLYESDPFDLSKGRHIQGAWASLASQIWNALNIAWL